MNRLNALWVLAGAIVLFPMTNGFAEHHRTSISVEDYRSAEVRIRKMIESGEVSKVRAEQRLRRMRQMIISENSEVPAS